MLETVIAENTAALRELIAALRAQATTAPNTGPFPASVGAIPVAVATPAATEPPEGLPAPTAGRARRHRADTATPAPTPAPPPAAAPLNEPLAAVKDLATTYESAAKAVTALIQRKGRPAAVAVLAQFKAAKLIEVPPEHFARVIELCEAA